MSDDSRIEFLAARTLMAWAPNFEEPEDLEAHPLFVAIVLELPKIGVQWTYAQRQAWLSMFNAIADGLHPESKASAQEVLRANIGDAQIEATGSSELVGMAFRGFVQAVAPKQESEKVEKVVAEPSVDADETEVEPEQAEPSTTFPLMRPTERNWIPSTYSGSKQAADVILAAIKQAGKPGAVWLNVESGKIRVSGEDYPGEGEDDELVGIYDDKARPGEIIRDIKAAKNRAAA